jgi:DNA replication and repair protein RecF
VRVVSAQLRDFRTYTRAEAHLGLGMTVVHGPNGAGKSNLLEAVYFGCTGHSQRTRNERELVRFGESTARVVVTLGEGGREHELSVGIQAPGPAGQLLKRMTADGAEVERLTDVASRPLISVFAPDRLELIKGPPAVRRAHLDQFVAAVWPLRASTRRRYGRALAQRNALLAGIRAGRASRTSLDAWDQELSAHALALRDDRLGAVALLTGPFVAHAEQLGLSGDVTVALQARSQAADTAEFAVELSQRLEHDLQRGFTTHGPHRDQLLIRRGGRDLRTYGSQGEQRLALLALLLAERAVLARERDAIPLMLLDDVMSELDSARRELLAGELAKGGQSVIATTDLEHVPHGRASSVTRLRVSPGSVLQEALAA